MKFKFFLPLLLFVFTLSSCSKDDDENIENELVFNGVTYPLKSGKLFDYSNMDPIIRYAIQLNSSELDENESPIDPIFNQFYFQVMNHGSPSKVEGLIGSSLMVFHAEPGNNSNLEAYNVNDGEVEVKYSDEIYTIKFHGTAVNTMDDEDDTEISFSGSYQGPLVNHEDFER